MESTTSVQFGDIQATLFFRVVMNYSSILLFFFLGKKKELSAYFLPRIAVETRANNRPGFTHKFQNPLETLGFT